MNWNNIIFENGLMINCERSHEDDAYWFTFTSWTTLEYSRESSHAYNDVFETLSILTTCGLTLVRDISPQGALYCIPCES